jgi:hypothetical protein
LSLGCRLDFPGLKNCLFRSGSAASTQKTFFQPPAGQPLPFCVFFGWLEAQPASKKLFFSAWPASRCAFELFLSQRLASQRSKNFFSALGWTPRTKKTFFQSREVQPAWKRQFLGVGLGGRYRAGTATNSARRPAESLL